MAITATTAKAPKSGSASSSPPTSTMAPAIGTKPFHRLSRKNPCKYTALREVKSAAYTTTASFISSDGCRFMKPSEIQRREPFTTLPIPGTSTSASSTIASRKIFGAQRCQIRVGTRNTHQPTPSATPSDSACRIR